MELVSVQTGGQETTVAVSVESALQPVMDVSDQMPISVRTASEMHTTTEKAPVFVRKAGWEMTALS
jgi:hypothetical protein